MATNKVCALKFHIMTVIVLCMGYANISTTLHLILSVEYDICSKKNNTITFIIKTKEFFLRGFRGSFVG